MGKKLGWRLAAASAFGLAVVLAGCGGNGSGKKVSQPDAMQPDEAGGELVPGVANDHRAFVSNAIHTNGRLAADPTCTGPEAASQMVVDGAPPYQDSACASATTQMECNNLKFNSQSPDGVAHGCAWSFAGCRTAYMIGGPCNTGRANLFYHYLGASSTVIQNGVGLLAIGGAAVFADDNYWQFGGSSGQDFIVGSSATDVISVSQACGPPPSTCP